MIAKDAPPHLGEQLRGIIDGVTKKIGGESVAPADLPFVDGCVSTDVSAR
jgi:hypothetical protein